MMPSSDPGRLGKKDALVRVLMPNGTRRHLRMNAEDLTKVKLEAAVKANIAELSEFIGLEVAL